MNILDLGLIYVLDIDAQGNVEIEMTPDRASLPCRLSTFPGVVEARVSEVPGINRVHVALVWEPPWSIDSMTDEVKLELGLL
ncbi:iron-sulfur cluster assembly protein [Massilia sp. B-10]|nr:iron-sulfur cluster assembly protein [Massilia sp. B-10]